MGGTTLAMNHPMRRNQQIQRPPFLSRMGGRIARNGMLAALAVLPALAYAGPSLPSSPSAALHVGKTTLDIIGQLAMAQVPPTIALPTIIKPLSGCPIGSSQISATVTNASVNITPDSISFQPEQGQLAVSAVLDLSGSAHVHITNGYACLSDADCDVTFAVQQLNPQAAIAMSVQNGNASITIPQLSASVPSGGIQVSFANCALDGLASGVTDEVAQVLFDLASPPLCAQLQQQMQPMLQQQISSMLTQSGNVSGYDLAASLTTLNMTADGVDAYAEVGLAYDGATAACLAPGAVAESLTTGTSGQLQLPSGPTSQVVVGVTTDLLNSAIQAAWQSGVMCVNDSQVAALGFDPSSIASLVPGLPAGMALHFSMGLDNPPTIEDDGMGGLQMRVTGAELLLAMTAPNQSPIGVAVITDFIAAITPTVSATNGSVYASLTDLSMQRLDIDAGATGTSLNLDPERLTVLMHDLVIPMANTRLATMPLSPASFGAAGIYGWLDTLLVQNGGLYVGLEPFLPPPAGTDFTPPITLLKASPGSLVRAGAAQFTLDGTDDTTPTQLLQYQWQVDSQPIVQGGFNRVIAAPVTTSGMHTFRAWAVDLAGNVDSVGITNTFMLDAVPPTLTVVGQPPPIVLRQSSVDIKVTGTDDQTATANLLFGYRVAVRPPGGTLTVTQSGGPTQFQDSQGVVTVKDLKSGSTYEVTLMVYDQAGNVTSTQLTFGAADVGGCTMGAHPCPLSYLSLALIGLAIFFMRRTCVLRTGRISR
jgi:hypothetical protein